MTSRLMTIVRHDIRLQYRYGIYAAYGFIVALYALGFFLTRSILAPNVVAVLIFIDPAALGFFFLGALMLLEKGEGVRTALTTTPLGASTYLGGKTITLTSVSLLACVILLLFAAHQANVVLLLVAVALTAIQYIGIGVPAAFYFRTVNGYIIGSAVVLTPLIAPAFLALLDPMPLWLAIIPSVSQLRLMLVAVGALSATPGDMALMLGVSGVAAVVCWGTAVRLLRQEFGA